MRFPSISASFLVGLLYSASLFALEQPSQLANFHPALANQASVVHEDIIDLDFKEFFKMPVGPRGLEPSEKLLSLANKRVRVVGYMAHEDDPTPGIFMLASHPINVGEKADGMADDLPASTLYVHMPERDADKILTYRPALWVLTGRLQLGNQEDLNGRVSYARLIMEPQDLDSANRLQQTLNQQTKN